MTTGHAVRAQHVLWRESLDAVLVLPPAAEHVLILTGTGAALWRVLADPRAIDDVAELVGDTAAPSLIRRLASAGALMVIEGT